MLDRTRTCDEGSITALVVVLAMTFVACAGLAIDGGRLVAAKIELGDQAENAARAGAQEVSSLRSGTLQIDQTRAVAAAEMFLASQGLAGEVFVYDNKVTVTVSRDVSMTLLSLFGARNKTLSARRSAIPVDGT
ncbi:MAG: pilus assembly protein TadG-related protein [Ilumatobacteraceae bacterium]